MDDSAPSAVATRPRGPARRVPLAVRRDPFTGEAARGLRRCGAAGGPIAVGVSGGADSVALLLALVALRERHRRPSPVPIAVHVHHHLREDDADEDAAFVGRLCRRLDVPVHVVHVEPARRPGNVAGIARDLRYDALARTASAIGSAEVAVAHHADDQLETMLIGLCRGAGVAGLSGMPWRRPLPGGVALLRPLLAVRGSACRAFCRTARVRWREDPGNVDPKALRARLRQEVLPRLKALWPDAARRASNGADAMRAAGDALESVLRAAFGPADRHRWPRADLADLPTSVIAAGLRRAAVTAAPAESDAFGSRLLRPAAEAIADGDRRPRRFDWPGGLHLAVTARQVALSPRKKEECPR